MSRLHLHQQDMVKKKSATLSRVGTPSKLSSLVSRDTVHSSEGPSDFTRVRRINTLKYIAHKPRPVLKSKSMSLSRKSSSLYKRYSKETARVKEADMETQELSLQIRSSFSSTSTSSSEESEELLKEGEICDKCHGNIASHEPYIQFGDDTLHLDCFKCGQCYQSMGSSMEIFLVNISGDPLCLGCSPTCYTCEKKILQNHISVLKKDFHEGCLSCCHCQRVSYDCTHKVRY